MCELFELNFKSFYNYKINTAVKFCVDIICLHFYSFKYYMLWVGNNKANYVL